MKTRLFFGFCLLLFAGTGCSVNWNRLKPLATPVFNREVPRRDARAALVFEEVIPGKPLSETVWDNSGPFWDPKHSKTIGFIQNYKDDFFTTTIQSRLMVPFGRIFSGMLASAASNSFSAYQIAFNPQDAPPGSTREPADVRIAVTITRFVVWEQPLNHLNLSLECRYRIDDRVKKMFPANTN